MKKCALVFLTMVSIHCTAQKIGVNVSANYSFYSLPADVKEQSSVPGLGVGITYRKSFDKNSAVVTGLDYQTYHYQVGRSVTNQSGATSSFSSRVINGMLQLPVLYEYRFDIKNVAPFVRLGFMAYTAKTTGTVDQVKSKTGVAATTPAPSAGSAEIVNTKKDNRVLGISPLLEFGTFGKCKGQQKWEITVGIFPTFSVPKYTILYRIDGELNSVASPKKAVITQLKVRYYVK